MTKPHGSIPRSFICPLTRRLMEDPVMDQCAHTFERRAILDWLDQHDSCPISRKPTISNDLLSNHTLAERIDRWQWERDNASLLKHVVDDERNDLSAMYDEETDVELARQRSREMRRKYEKDRRELYPIFLLLPQEEAVLRVERLKEEALERDQRRKTTQCMILSVCLFLGLLALSYMIVNRLVFETVEEEEEAAPGITDEMI